MAEPLVITIPGEAKGKGRPRFAKRGNFVQAYTDAATVSAENWIKACAVQQIGSPVLPGPLAMTVEIHVTIPASWSKKKQAAAATGEIMPTGRPDIDNVFKALADALNGIVWVDDSQIVTIQASKRYAAKPQTTLTIAPL